MENLKGKSIASMVLGIVAIICAWFGYLSILSLACSIVGLVLAINVRKTCQANNVKPDGMATAGMVMSIIALALSVVMLIIVIACASYLGCAACAVAAAY